MVHRHPTPEELALRAARRTRMSRALRTTLLGVCALLWLSGALWLLLDLWFPEHNEFGSLPNPWEAPLLRLHGLVAVAAVFLFGWVAAGHIPVRWRQGMNRPSGLWLLGFAGILVLSGYALYYTTAQLHAAAALVHEWLGLAALIAALAHWRRSGAR
ncbi:MAG TPA: hypothetical protein VLV29_09910 [Steroidobacteraceae bacterium]|nr:hypothetical protein [Steroidobacteraceae bacterium]